MGGGCTKLTAGETQSSPAHHTTDTTTQAGEASSAKYQAAAPSPGTELSMPAPSPVATADYAFETSSDSELMERAGAAVGVQGVSANDAPPGCAILRVYLLETTEGQQVVCRYGFAGRRRASEGDGGSNSIRAHDKWHLGSCAKPMVAMLFALMTARSEIDRNVTVGEALSKSTDAAPLLQNISSCCDGKFLHVKVLDILRHAGGLPGGPVCWEFAWDLHHKNQEGAEPRTARQQRRAWLEAVFDASDSGNCIVQQEANGGFAAGTYSNTGYCLVGHILEETAGMDFETLIAEKLFIPLGIATYGFGACGRESEAVCRDQPWGHSEQSKWEPVDPAVPEAQTGIASDNPTVLTPAGRIHMTIQDWARFVSVCCLSRDLCAQVLGLPVQSFDEAMFCSVKEDSPHAEGGWIICGRDWAADYETCSSGKATLSTLVTTHAGSNTLSSCVCWTAPGGLLGRKSMEYDGADCPIKAFAGLLCTNTGNLNLLDEIIGPVIGSA